MPQGRTERGRGGAGQGAGGNWPAKAIFRGTWRSLYVAEAGNQSSRIWMRPSIARLAAEHVGHSAEIEICAWTCSLSRDWREAVFAVSLRGRVDARKSGQMGTHLEKCGFLSLVGGITPATRRLFSRRICSRAGLQRNMTGEARPRVVSNLPVSRAQAQASSWTHGQKSAKASASEAPFGQRHRNRLLIRDV